jgi:hypothetical protein
MDAKMCAGCGTLRADRVEDFIYSEMLRKVARFKTLTRANKDHPNPKLTSLRVSLAQLDTEIEKLLNTLSGANAVLLSYANGRIVEMDSARQLLQKQIADLSAESVSSKQIEQISDYLDNWNEVGFDDRRLVANGLISTIEATSAKIHIGWKF